MTNKILKPVLGTAALALLATGCVDEFEPQSSTVTINQVSAAPGAYDNFVSAITSTFAGQFVYWPAKQYPFDFGYSAFFLARDITGQDIATRGDWFSYWYESTASLGPTYAICQFPWTCYYSWIKSCNTVISVAKADLTEDKENGLGQAYAVRAMLYLDLAQMYCSKTYSLDKDNLTVPIVSDETSSSDLANNPNATNEEIYNFIISDLDNAEQYISKDKVDAYTVGINLVYGLKARAYLIMNDWANAEKYAKLAQDGYSVMSQDEYTDWTTGFNTPNEAWIYALQFKSDDPCILNNDADSSWGSQMCVEIDPVASQCGYAANYGQPHLIDRHLYETIPSTDCRKKCYVDFSIDDMSDEDQQVALAAYTNHPTWLQNCAAATDEGTIGGLELKFRTAGGETGRANQMIGFLVSVPVMRVEEMKLIEAEAAAWQDEARGKSLLEAFAKTRDDNYVYGQHNEAYGNSSTPAIINEIWWQRRVELWGEGFAMGDIKRLNKGIIRSYSGTNHRDGYQWNTSGPADWMNFCIVQTETNYNPACVSNPAPIAPEGNSAPYTF